MIIDMIAAIVILGLLLWNLSLQFRRSYLKQKLVNRLNPHDLEIVDRTDLDFWSFVK